MHDARTLVVGSCINLRLASRASKSLESLEEPRSGAFPPSTPTCYTLGETDGNVGQLHPWKRLFHSIVTDLNSYSVYRW